MNRIIATLIVPFAAGLLALPAFAQMDAPALSGDVQVARQALPALTQAYCGDPQHIAEYQTYCQLTSVKMLDGWALLGWYEGESSGDAIAHFDGEQWRMVYVATPYGSIAEAVASQVPREIAEALLPEATAGE